MEFLENEKVIYIGPNGVSGLNYPKINEIVTINKYECNCICGCDLEMYSLKEYPIGKDTLRQGFTSDVFKKIVTMNIVEAFQAAENGKFITNNFLKPSNKFLKYIASGIFYEYEVFFDNRIEYKYEISEFSTAYILSTGWEIVDNKIINKHFKNK